MIRVMGGVLLTVGGALALFAGWFYVMQPAMIFFPYRALQSTPAQWGLTYEDVRLEAADGVRLHGWYIPREGARRVLLFFHGNAGNISHRRESIEIFHRLGLDVFILDYRGYGRSEGRPSESGLYADALAAWQYLVEQRGVEPQRIILFGRSLGGAVAASLAAHVEAGGLILESSFSSAGDFVRAYYPLLSWLIIRRFEFNSAERLESVSYPVMVLHSRGDEIMPFELGEKLYAAARPPKMFWEMEGDHNSGFLVSQPGYERALAHFLSEQVAPVR